ncbi:MAG: peptidoglycan editing factor PgeF [Gammaproteobacteria bacterium]|nr:MAG: peptidoglycan editing factor PgeF [Gammaproteobacteria bacterium]
MADALALIRPDWPAPARVRAVATTRAGGVSRGAFATLNLGLHVGDDPEAVRENRARLVAALGLAAGPLWLHQVHGTTVADAATAAPVPVADAMVAGSAGLACVIMTADCLPVLFCNAAGTVVAAAHAGWRGLAAGVLEATVAALADRGAAATTLMAWIGPAISAPAYEVGADVRAAFLAADPAAAAGFTPNARGRWQLDLPGLARQRLGSLGVGAIYGGDLCTATDPRRYFSHRRDGACGRQATLIWLT